MKKKLERLASHAQEHALLADALNSSVADDKGSPDKAQVSAVYNHAKRHLQIAKQVAKLAGVLVGPEPDAPEPAPAPAPQA